MTSYLKFKKQMVVLDADDTEIESWITVRGNHIPIKKGQSKEEAVKSFLESKGSGEKTESSTKTQNKEDEKLWEQAYQNVREKDNDTDPSGFYRPTDFMSPTELRDYHEKQEKDIQAEYERLKNKQDLAKKTGQTRLANGYGEQLKDMKTEAEVVEKRAFARWKERHFKETDLGTFSDRKELMNKFWHEGYNIDNTNNERPDYEYVWKDGNMYTISFRKQPNGQLQAYQSQPMPMSYSEFIDEIDSGSSNNNDDGYNDNDSDISGIESKEEASRWLDTQIRKYGNTYFWKDDMKSALNKLVNKFGNTYFWDK